MRCLNKPRIRQLRIVEPPFESSKALNGYWLKAIVPKNVICQCMP